MMARGRNQHVLGCADIVKGLEFGSNQCEIYGERPRMGAVSNSTCGEVAMLDSSKLSPVQSRFWMSLEKASEAVRLAGR